MTSTPQAETSTTLLRAVSEGDQDSWVRFVDLYRPVLIRKCREMGLSAEDSDCMAQDVFIELFRRIDKFNRQRAGSFRKWLKMVLHSRIIDDRRRRKIAPELYESLDFVSCLLPEVDEVLQEQKSSAKIHTIIETIQTQFSGRDWAVFYLTIGEERPAKEVAETLEITENMVYLCKSRMLKKLRRTYTTQQAVRRKSVP
jgi:RNA polymerase sigma-70 factor (ECF subfamily)